MASLLDNQTQQRHYLKAHTTLGRLATSVDLLVNKPEVSKIHAVIEWHQDQWLIKDLSSNGTWLNQQKIVRNTPVPLNEGDVINLASADGYRTQLNDLSAPQDMLIPLPGNTQPAIALSAYNLLPNDNTPSASLVYNAALNHWDLELLTQEPSIKQSVHDGQLVVIDGQQWRLQTNTEVEATAQLSQQQQTVADLHFHFDVSQDEETTKLQLQLDHQRVDLKARSHHYLALLLARKRIIDAKHGLNDATQGWLYAEQLSRDLGIEMCHLNIQIHRLRKQVSDLLPQVSDLDNLIERQSGQLRLGSRHIHIIKGGEVEV